MRAHGHADSEFGHAAGHRIRDHAVKSDRGEHQGGRGEQAQQSREEARAGAGAGQDVLHGAYLRKGQRRIDLAYRVANSGDQ